MSTYGELGTFSLKDCISTIAFSPNGDYFAAGGLDESLFVW
jgi:WD40 repeat protein